MTDESIEVTKANAKGFYETQGWGPNFIVPTRSRIDVPYNEMWIKLAEATKGVPVKGVAFGGDRGISRVEFSSDDGENWDDAKIDYPGTKLGWALWSFNWEPDEIDDYTLVVRATDGDSKVQEFEENRSFHRVSQNRGSRLHVRSHSRDVGHPERQPRDPAAEALR